MLQGFFLDYANFPLDEDPRNLGVFVTEIVVREDGWVQEDVDEYHDVVEGIIFLAKGEKANTKKGSFGIEEFITIAKGIQPLSMQELKNEIKREYPWVAELGVLDYFINVYDMASRTAFGHLECPKYCWDELYEARRNLAVMDSFKKPKDLTCYECDQLHFIQILSEIIEGKQYHSIEGLEPLIEIANEKVKIRIEIELLIPPKDTSSYTSLRKTPRVEIPLRSNFPLSATINPFRESLIGAAAYTLTEFLQKENRRKLKRCSNCMNFYIAKTVRANQKYCSDRCKRASNWPHEKRNAYMRDYRKKRRKEAQRILDKKKEKEIQRRMEVGGYTRREVIDQMEADRRIDQDM